MYQNSKNIVLRRGVGIMKVHRLARTADDEDESECFAAIVSEKLWQKKIRFGLKQTRESWNNAHRDRDSWSWRWNKLHCLENWSIDWSKGENFEKRVTTEQRRSYIQFIWGFRVYKINRKRELIPVQHQTKAIKIYILCSWVGPNLIILKAGSQRFHLF